MTNGTQRALAIAGAFTALALTACSASGGSAAPAVDEAGVTKTTVTVGTHQPLTGPAAAGYASISAATGAYFDYVNDKGGINGRTIEYIVKDDGYNPATTRAVVSELVENDDVFAIVGGLGTPTHAAVLDYLNANKVPDLFVASGSPTWNQPEKYPYTFGFMADYTTESQALATYAQEEYSGKKYCFLGQDDDFGTEYKAGVESILGADAITSSQAYSVTSTDVSTQIATMKAAGCEVNILATINGFTALSLGTAATLGYFPQWLAATAGGDYNTLASYLGESTNALLQGFISANYLPSHFSETDEWTAQFRAINEKYNAGAPFDGNTVFGMSVGYLFAEALAKSGEYPTRASLITAIESGALAGNGHAPLGFSGSRHSGYMGVQLMRVDNGVQEYFGTPFVTDGAEMGWYTDGLAPMPKGAIPKA